MKELRSECLPLIVFPSLHFHLLRNDVATLVTDSVDTCPGTRSGRTIIEV